MSKREVYTEDIDADEENLWEKNEYYLSVKNQLDNIHRMQFKKIPKKTRELLFNPDSFFKSLCQKPRNIVTPLLIILGLCLIHGNYISFFNSHIYEYSANNPAMLVYMIAAFISSTFSSISTWIIISLIFTIPLYYYKKTSFTQFIRTLTWVGYGMVPDYILFVVDKILNIFTLPIQQSVYHKYLSYSYTGQMNGIFQVNHLIRLDPVIIGIDIFYFIFSIFFLLWNGKIWYYGLIHGESLPERESSRIIYFGLGIIIAEQFVFLLIR